MAVSPIVILGDQFTGSGSDDTTQGFRKYNTHVHSEARVTDFLAYDVAMADPVYLYNVDDQLVYNTITPPEITYLSATQLRLSTTVNQTLTDTVLYVKAPKEEPETAVVIRGVTIEAGSNIIEFTGDLSSGFIADSQLQALSADQLNHTFTIPSGVANYTYPLVFPSANKTWVRSLAIASHHGKGIYQLIAKRENQERLLVDIDIQNPGVIHNVDLTDASVDGSVFSYPNNLLPSPLDEYSYLNFKVLQTEPTINHVVVSLSLEIQKVL
jgi:hypothetical protein